MAFFTKGLLEGMYHCFDYFSPDRKKLVFLVFCMFGHLANQHLQSGGEDGELCYLARWPNLALPQLVEAGHHISHVGDLPRVAFSAVYHVQKF